MWPSCIHIMAGALNAPFSKIFQNRDVVYCGYGDVIKVKGLF